MILFIKPENEEKCNSMVPMLGRLEIKAKIISRGVRENPIPNNSAIEILSLVDIHEFFHG